MDAAKFRELIGRVAEDASGRWDYIFNRLAPALAPAVSARGRHVPCPVHGGKDGFRIWTKHFDAGACICNTCGTFSDGFGAIAWVNGWTQGKSVLEVDEILRGRASETPPPPRRLVAPTKVADEKAERSRVQKIRAVWSESIPLESAAAEPARLYLANRGLSYSRYPGVLRLHPSLPYWEQRDDKPAFVGRFPALVALVTDAKGRAFSLHRIYITPDGRKAPVAEPKKTMTFPNNHDFAGTAIRLTLPGRLLNIAEGIETALAVIELTNGMPTWSVLNAGLMRGFVAPPGTEFVCVWADKDRSHGGQDAAEALVHAVRARGLQAVAIVPPASIPDGEKSVDWRDMLAVYGAGKIQTLGFYRRLQQMFSGTPLAMRAAQ